MPNFREMEIVNGFNSIFDKKNIEYEIDTTNTLPFVLSNVIYPSGKNQPPNYSAYYNNFLNKFEENDLFLEQLTLNIQESKNIYGAKVTGSKQVALAGNEGEKYILTSNVEPSVQMVHKIPSEINDSIYLVKELSNVVVNFIEFDGRKYVAGTGNGLFNSTTLSSGWERVTDNDAFLRSFNNINCKCCLYNKSQFNLPNSLKKYQYFLGTNAGLFGLQTVGDNGVVIEYPYWKRLHGYSFDEIQINVLKIDKISGKLFIGTNSGLYSSDGDELHFENETNGLTINTIDFLTEDETSDLLVRNEYILIGTNAGFRQSEYGEYAKNFRLIGSGPISENQDYFVSIPKVEEDTGNVYFSFKNSIYKIQNGIQTKIYSFDAGKNIIDFTVFGNNVFCLIDAETRELHKIVISNTSQDTIVQGLVNNLAGILKFSSNKFIVWSGTYNYYIINSSGNILNTQSFSETSSIKNIFNCSDFDGKTYIGVNFISESNENVLDFYYFNDGNNEFICDTSLRLNSEKLGLNDNLNLQFFSANLLSNETYNLSSEVFSFGIVSLDFNFYYLSSAFDEISCQTINPLQTILNDDNRNIYFQNGDFFSKYNTQAGYFDVNIPTGFNVEKIDGLYSGKNGNVFMTYGNRVFMFNGTETQRKFGNPRKKYKILKEKFYKKDIRSTYMIDHENFLVGTFDFMRYVKNLYLAIEPKDFEENIVLKGPCTSINYVEHYTEGGVSKRYLFSSGRMLFSSEDNISILEETSLGSEYLIVNSIYCPNGTTYAICTSEGLYFAEMGYTLVNDLDTYSVVKLKTIDTSIVSAELISHINEYHNNNEFFKELSTKSPAKLQSVPNNFTPNNKTGLYNAVQIIKNDVVEKIEFEDTNKYIKASVSNWVLDLIEAGSIYSDDGFVDWCVDPTDGTRIDFSVVPYVCKFWNSGLKEITAYIPTTMTYYLNNPYGFTNSIYNYTSIPRRNLSFISGTTNRISEKTTRLRLLLNNVHFQIKNIYSIQINGNSLPLRIYKDANFCQPGRENLFDTVIQPSIVNSLPVLENAGSVNNAEFMVDSINLTLAFSIYGTDSQSIRILAE